MPAADCHGCDICERCEDALQEAARLRDTASQVAPTLARLQAANERLDADLLKARGELADLHNEAQCSGDNIASLNGMLEAAENRATRAESALAQAQEALREALREHAGANDDCMCPLCEFARDLLPALSPPDEEDIRLNVQSSELNIDQPDEDSTTEAAE